MHELFSFEAITQQKLFDGRALPRSDGGLSNSTGGHFAAGDWRGENGREEKGA